MFSQHQHNIEVVVAVETGEAAYPVLFAELDGPGQLWLDHHAWLAERWAWIAGLNAVGAGVVFVLGGRRPEWRRRGAGIVLATCVLALAAAVGIAEAGGKIRHAEFRLEEPPLHDAPKTR